MKVLLNGQYSALARNILSLIGNHTVTSLDTLPENKDSLRALFNEVSPEVLINCHELGDLDKAEYFRNDAYEANALCLKLPLEICHERSILFVQAGTSHIFDGHAAAPYTETDEPLPQSVYGDSKLLAENMIRASGAEFLVLRFADLFGADHCCVKQAVGGALAGAPLQAVRGQCMSPVWIRDAAAALLALVEKGARGVYHYSYGQVKTAEFFKYALDLYAVSHPLDYVISEVDERELAVTAARPLFNVLDNGKFAAFTGPVRGDWQQGLREYIAHLEMNHETV